MGVPNNIVVPFMGVQFDSSRAFIGSGNMPVKVLLFGQKTAGGTGNTEEQLLVFNADAVGKLAGYGSMVHRMAIRYYANNNITETNIILLDDAAGSTAATTDITIANAVVTAGEVVLYISGTRYAVGAAVGATAEEVAALLVLAVNNDSSAPVTATNAAGVVTLTAKNKGIAAGEIDIRLNYNAGEEVPAGLTITVGATTAGTVDPDVQDVLDVFGDTWYNVLASGYNDATSMGKIEDFLETAAGPTVQRDGMYYTGKRGTVSELITFATDGSRNCAYATLIDTEYMPASNSEVAAGKAARVAESIMQDTAVPLHRMTLSGFLTVEPTQRRTLQERNTLASNGVATLTYTLGVQTEATVTMYLKNAAGAADIAYQQQNTVYQLMYARYSFVQRILTRYPRAKLADNVDRVQSGQQFITPAIGKAEAIAWFLQLEAEGILENADQFKAELKCVRSTSNPNRLEWLLPPDLVNQFIVGSADMQFILES